MKILVTGAAGLLGHDVWKLFEHKHDLMAIGRTQASWVDSARFRECDLTNAARTYAIVTKENPELIVHCAAYNQVDKAEAEPDEAYKGNALATRNIALACQRFDATLIHISTDYVFDGESALESGYREMDECHPVNVYGVSKRWAEVFVQQLLTNYFIVRTSWLFGPSRPTWVDQVASHAQSDKEIIAVTDMVSAPTYTPDLAEALLRLAESRHYGLYHITNAGFTSRAEMAEEILRIMKINSYPHLRKLKQTELRLPAHRPSFSGMDNLAWRLDGFPPLRGWKDAMQAHFKKPATSTRSI